MTPVTDRYQLLRLDSQLLLVFAGSEQFYDCGSARRVVDHVREPAVQGGTVVTDEGIKELFERQTALIENLGKWKGHLREDF